MNLILLLSILFIRFSHRFLSVPFEELDWKLPQALYQGPASGTLANGDQTQNLNVCAGDSVRIVLYISDHHFEFFHAISIFGNTCVLAVFYTQ
jgi:hypothetical protein